MDRRQRRFKNLAVPTGLSSPRVRAVARRATLAGLGLLPTVALLAALAPPRAAADLPVDAASGLYGSRSPGRTDTQSHALRGDDSPAGWRPIRDDGIVAALLESAPLLEHRAAAAAAPQPIVDGLGRHRGAASTLLQPPVPAESALSIDGFEDDPWPDAALWPVVVDLMALDDPVPDPDSGYPWAPNTCVASSGGRSLRAIGGGDGAGLACDAAYPAGIASSALLLLDLRSHAHAGGLWLTYDLWMDSEPDEGLLINYVLFAPDGTTAERRVVFSATGLAKAWSEDIRLDLTDLRDRLDPGWSLDLRGGRAYLEFLFVSLDGSPTATGAWLDDLALIRAEPTPSPTPTASPTASRTPSPTTTPTATPLSTPVPTALPTPADRTVACTSSSDCLTLNVRAYVDYGCDGRYQAGVDRLLSGARVAVSADAEMLGTELGRTGSAVFRFPRSASVRVELGMPDGYEACPASPNPALLDPDDFRRGDRASTQFGVRKKR